MPLDARPERQQATVDVRPDRLTDEARARLSALFIVLSQVRRRLWVQRSVARSVRLLTLGGLLFASLVVLIRSAAIPAAWDGQVALGGLALSGVLWMGLHRVRWRVAAHTLDACADGYDRAATALDLVVHPSDPAWTVIQAAAATAWADTVDVARALPWRRPAGLVELSIAGLSLLTAFALPLDWIAPAGRGGVASAVHPYLPAAPLAFSAAADLLSADALTLLREDAEVLEDIAKQVDDQATKRWLKRVTKVLRDVEQGKVDKRSALQQLAELERMRPGAATDNEHAAANLAEKDAEDGEKATASSAPGVNDAADGAHHEQRAEQQRQADRAVSHRVADALAEALKEAPAGALRDAIKQAAEKKDLGLMGKMLEKLAEHAQKNMNDKELSKWMKVAEKFANKLGDQKVPKKFAALERRVRRLQAKRKRQGGLGQGDRRRLASHKRQLQRLRKKHGDVQAAKYQLQRLQKEAKKAAAELRRTRQESRRLTQKRGKRSARERRRQQARSKMRRSLHRNMHRAAGEMRRQSGQQRTRQAQRIGQRRLRDLKDTLRRSGQKSVARRDFERRARQRRTKRRRRQPKKPSLGQQSRAAAQKRAHERAARRARRDTSRSNRRNKVARKFKLGGGDMPDRTRMRMMRQGPAAGQGAKGPPGAQRGAGGEPGGTGNKPGSGAGGPNEGRRKPLAVARTEKITGAHGDGPSIKRVFTEAAKRGFARRGWQQVYADYSEVAEEMMESEGLPVGRKALVKRYFELIRPR